MEPPAKRTTDWLRWTDLLLAILMVLNIIYVAVLLFTPVSELLIAVPFDHLLGPDPVSLRHQAAVDPRMVEVALRHPTVVQWILYVVHIGLPTLLVTTPALVLARRVVRLARIGDPFTPAMVRQLRVLGFWLLIGGALATLVEIIASVALESTVAAGALLPDAGTSLWWLLLSLVILAVAEVMNRGCTLRAELDEVI